jgi:uncharacterized membrane protein (DUF106 family)
MEKTKQQISIELREIQREISKARSMRNWAKITYLNQKRLKLQEEMDYIKSKEYEYECVSKSNIIHVYA